jgi:hypothetical protein
MGENSPNLVTLDETDIFSHFINILTVGDRAVGIATYIGSAKSYGCGDWVRS